MTAVEPEVMPPPVSDPIGARDRQRFTIAMEDLTRELHQSRQLMQVLLEVTAFCLVAYGIYQGVKAAGKVAALFQEGQ